MRRKGDFRMKAIEQELQAVVDLAVGDAGPGAILGVTAPHLGLEWKGASGAFKRDTRKRLKANDGFRIASMSKTFTATLVMQLVEQGRLSLDARLRDFFPMEFVRRVHPRASAITLAHLLNHTAGLWDFAMSEAWGAELRGDPGRFRHPDAILEWAVTHGATGRRRWCRTHLFRHRLRDSRPRSAAGYRCCVQDAVPAPHIQTVANGTDLARRPRETADYVVALVFRPMGRTAIERQRGLGGGWPRVDRGRSCAIRSRAISRRGARFAGEPRPDAGNRADAESSIWIRCRHQARIRRRAAGDGANVLGTLGALGIVHVLRAGVASNRHRHRESRGAGQSLVVLEDRRLSRSRVVEHDAGVAGARSIRRLRQVSCDGATVIPVARCAASLKRRTTM